MDRDELVDYHVSFWRFANDALLLQIHVVTETRQYRELELSSDQSPSSVVESSAIIHAKSVLNALHVRMANEGYDQVRVV